MKLGTKTAILGLVMAYGTVNAKDCIEIVDVEAEMTEQCRVKIGNTINIVYAEDNKACDLLKESVISESF